MKESIFVLHRVLQTNRTFLVPFFKLINAVEMKINWTRLVEIDCKAQLIKVYFLYTALVPNSTETELDAWRERLHTLDFCASDHHFNNCLSSSLPALTRKHQSLCRCPLFTHTLQRDTFTWTYIWGNWTVTSVYTCVSGRFFEPKMVLFQEAFCRRGL